MQNMVGEGREFTLLVRAPHNRQFPYRALDFDSIFQSARAVGSLFAATGRGFLESLFDRFTGFAGALLNAAQQFVVLAFGELEIVIRELGPFLFQLALGDVPVAFAFESVHNNSLVFVFACRQRDGKSVPAAVRSEKLRQRIVLSYGV
jgi:hypothetical protein